MNRFLGFALIVLLPLTVGLAPGGGKQKLDKDIKIDGTLTKNDPKDKRRGGACHVHTVRLRAGQTYTIDMVSNEMDSYLFLDDKDGKQLAEDDDSGGNLNAQIVFNCTKDGEYKVVCTVFAANMVGKYTLTVKNNASAGPLATPHQLLIGKAAPDFHADFAVNGKAGKLSDLKGKVVLLAFWEMRNLASEKAFPHLRNWHKAHHDNGLEIVGVTFYNSEIGQHLGFDKETGKVTPVDAADKQSDQTTFRLLAAHHKLDCMLMALPKTEALRTFEAYAVNGLPQFVLIDRDGMVRTVFVGERNIEGLESAIKKALEEK